MTTPDSNTPDGTTFFSRIFSLQLQKIYLALLLIIIAVAFIFLVIVPLFTNSNNWMLIGFPDNNSEVDLSLLKYGQDEKEAITLAKNAAESRVLLLTTQTNETLSMAGNEMALFPSVVSYINSQTTRIGNFTYDFGGFNPNSRYLFYWHKDGEKTSINRIMPGDNEPSLLFETESFMTSGDIIKATDAIFLVETRDDKLRCYVSNKGKEAERFGKGFTCGITFDGLKTHVTEKSADDETSIILMDINGDNEKLLLDNVEGVVDNQFSFDGSKIAYIQKNNDQFQMIVLDTASGKIISESDRFISITDFKFSQEGDSLFYIGEIDNGELLLFSLGLNNKEAKIATGYAINAKSSLDGKYLVYLIRDEDGEYGLHTYDISSSVKTEILRGDSIQFGILDNPARILIQQQEDEELIVYSAQLDGQGLTKLYSEDDTRLSYANFIPSENLLYLYLQKKGKVGLFVTSMDKEDGILAVEDWNEIDLLSHSTKNGQIIFTGREEESDDPALYSVTLTDEPALEELDGNADRFTNAVFAPNSKDVIYTAVTGADPDEVEIRVVGVDGAERYEVLYDRAFLIDTQWASPDPFLFVNWRTPLTGTSYCPGAPTLELGKAVDGNIKTDKEECFRLSITNTQPSYFMVESSVNTSLEFYNREGALVLSDNDSGEGENPLLRASITEEGIYYIVVKAGEVGDYSLQWREGVGNPVFDNATQLTAGNKIRSEITSSSNIVVNANNYQLATYGTMYYFDAKAGEQVQIDVLSNELGSKLDPYSLLFDPYLAKITEDDDSGARYDSKINYSVTKDGRYYLLVKANGNGYSNSNKYYYDILLSTQ